MNASEERLVSECCTVFFGSSVLLRLFCTINTRHVGVDYLIIYLLCRILGGLKIFLEGWTFCLGGGVIANIGGRVAPPHKIRLWFLDVLLAIPPFLSHAQKSKPAERRDRSQSNATVID